MMEHGLYWGLVPLNKKEYNELIEKAKKLEEVKKFVENGPSLNVDTLEDCQQVIDDWLGKLMNIIEAGD